MLIWAAAVILVLIVVVTAVKPVFEKISERRILAYAVRDVGCEKRHWLFGHARHIPPSEIGMMRNIEAMKRHPKSIQRWFGPFAFYFNSFHPDLVKPALNNDEPKDDMIYKFLRPWVGDGLLTSHGNKWKRNRRLLTPAFHFESLKRYVPCTNDAAAVMLQKWDCEGSAESKSVEVFGDVSLMTLDNLLRCIFSKDKGCESGENKNYLIAVKRLTEEAVLRIRNPFFHSNFIYFLTPSGKRYKKALQTAHNYTETAIQERMDLIKIRGCDYRKVTEYDFLDVLLMAKDENGIGLTHQEIRDELDTFVFEGHDTVTSGISWAFYNLALHPNCQEMCRDEVLSVLDSTDRVKWEHLPKFEYLTKFIKESMRVNPPVLSVGRRTTQPILFPRGFGSDQYNCQRGSIPTEDASRTLPKNMSLGVNIFMLHRNPTVWKNPEIFDPERFNAENVSQRSPHAYVPFSSGPRNCIGQNFAMNEMKTVLALALSRYRFTVDVSQPKPEMEPHLIMRSKTGIHLLVEKL